MQEVVSGEGRGAPLEDGPRIAPGTRDDMGRVNFTLARFWGRWPGADLQTSSPRSGAIAGCFESGCASPVR